jgi:hypothetical protein
MIAALVCASASNAITDNAITDNASGLLEALQSSNSYSSAAARMDTNARLTKEVHR